MLLELLGAIFLATVLAFLYFAAHAHANPRTLYLTRDRDPVARFIPPIRQ